MGVSPSHQICACGLVLTIANPTEKYLSTLFTTGLATSMVGVYKQFHREVP